MINNKLFYFIYDIIMETQNEEIKSEPLKGSDYVGIIMGIVYIIAVPLLISYCFWSVMWGSLFSWLNEKSWEKRIVNSVFDPHAQDAERRSDLNSISSAISTVYNFHWYFPWEDIPDDEMVELSKIEDILKEEVEIEAVPRDPNPDALFEYNWKVIKWEYWYMKYKEQGVMDRFALMAKADTEWWANFVYDWSHDFKITDTCNKVEFWNEVTNNNWYCTYTNKDQLRYVYHW